MSTNCPAWPPDGAPLDPFGTEWLKYARLVESFELDVEWETPDYCPSWLVPPGSPRLAVAPPDLPLSYKSVRSAAVEGREAALIDYYRQMPAIPPPAQRSETARHNLFSVDVVIAVPGHYPIAAKTFDNGWRAALQILKRCADIKAAPFIAYDDQDQGWGLRILIEARDVFVLPWDPEANHLEVPDQPLRFPRAPFAAQAAAAASRLERIHAALVAGVGRDLWQSEVSRASWREQ